MNDIALYLLGLGFLIYYYFAVSWGLSFKQILFHYLYSLGMSLIVDYLNGYVSDISILLIIIVCFGNIFYFSYLRKRVAFNEPINKRLLNIRSFVEEYFQHYTIESGFNYKGFFTNEIKQLKKGKEVVLGPVYSYLETESKAYFLTNNYVILDLQTGVFSDCSDLKDLSQDDREVFKDLEVQKKAIIIELENNMNK